MALFFALEWVGEERKEKNTDEMRWNVLSALMVGFVCGSFTMVFLMAPQHSSVSLASMTAPTEEISDKDGKFMNYTKTSLQLQQWLFSRPSPRRQGTFMEMGALNGGVMQRGGKVFPSSHTLYFEKEFDWRGVLVEPTCMYCQVLQNRPLAATFQNAACAPIGDVKSFAVSCPSFSDAGWAAAARSGLTTTISDKGGFALWAAGQYTMNVTCTSVEGMLLEAGIQSVDLFVLDVEGAEAEVLRSLRGLVSFHVIMVETVPGWQKGDALVRKNKGRSARVKEWMVAAGMKLAHTTEMDEVWVNESFVPEVAPARKVVPSVRRPATCPEECDATTGGSLKGCETVAGDMANRMKNEKWRKLSPAQRTQIRIRYSKMAQKKKEESHAPSVNAS